MFSYNYSNTDEVTKTDEAYNDEISRITVDKCYNETTISKIKFLYKKSTLN
jgi:hypothetical protein